MRSRTLLVMLLPMLVSCDAWKLEAVPRPVHRKAPFRMPIVGSLART